MLGCKYGSVYFIMGLFFIIGCEEDPRVTNSYTAIVENLATR